MHCCHYFAMSFIIRGQAARDRPSFAPSRRAGSGQAPQRHAAFADTESSLQACRCNVIGVWGAVSLRTALPQY